jgi:hypothetical protein
MRKVMRSLRRLSCGLGAAAILLCATCSDRTRGDANDCETRLELYYKAVEAAGQCDPTAAVPCTAYEGVQCPPVGVNPGSSAALSAKLSEDEAAGCELPVLMCPLLVMTPPPYTCQAGADGVYRCYCVCEQMVSGAGTCVSESAGCPNGSLPAGFCSGASMLCCAPSGPL